MAQDSSIEKNTTILDGPTQVIYCDRILNLAFGSSVSKLILGMEVGPNTYVPSVTLVIPTNAFLDALDFLSKSVHENKEAKDVIIKGIDVIKAQFNKL